MLLGIVGKPSSGKTTFLNATCMTSAKVGSYPFTTIEPNPGVAYVRTQCVCKELDLVCKPNTGVCIDGARLIPVDMLDVAGLVPDAWQGRGLGNKFLSDLSRANGLIHVVDASGSLNADGQEIESGKWNPLTDVDFLDKEIRMWFVNIIKRDWRRLIGKVQLEKSSLINTLEEKLSGLVITKSQIERSLHKSELHSVPPSDWKDEEFMRFARELQKNAKPMIISANKIDRESSAENYQLMKKALGEQVIPCCALGEYALRTYAEKGVVSYRPGDDTFTIKQKEQLNDKTMNLLDQLKTNVLEQYGSTGVQDCVNKMVFHILQQIVVYPVEDLTTFSDHNGNVLPDAFLVPKGTTAKELAYMIHTDLGETFIHAINGRTKRRIGEDYELQENDIIKIVSASGHK
jgi:ribosome-binding ATPase YchF (GTP1/OBG family)